MNFNEIQELIKKLHIPPMALVRHKEPIWIENFKNKSLSDDEIISALQKFPILIERPIVIKGKKAIIGRDLEKVSEFLLT